jgi:hypothetical protein
VSYTISGRVVVGDSPNNSLVTPGAGLTSATVEVVAGVAAQPSVQTLTDGAFRIERVSGAVTLRVSHEGFSPATRTVTVTSDMDLHVELRALSGGRLADTQAARDILEWNQSALAGSSYRRTDLISRWELPVPVYLSDGIERDRVIDALEYWWRAAGISYVVIATDSLPRIFIRPGTDGLGAQGGGRALIDGTLTTNRANSGLAVFQPGGGGYCINTASVSCRCLYRHEIGHALGHLGHSNDGLMGTCAVDELSARSRAMMAALYSLPHGARMESDGTWWVRVE